MLLEKDQVDVVYTNTNYISSAPWGLVLLRTCLILPKLQVKTPLDLKRCRSQLRTALASWQQSTHEFHCKAFVTATTKKTPVHSVTKYLFVDRKCSSRPQCKTIEWKKTTLILKFKLQSRIWWWEHTWTDTQWRERAATRAQFGVVLSLVTSLSHSLGGPGWVGGGSGGAHYTTFTHQPVQVGTDFSQQGIMGKIWQQFLWCVFSSIH